MKWCRLYHSLLTCAKVQNLPERLFKFWVNCLLLASENSPRGVLPPEETIAFRLGLRAPFVRGSLAKLARTNLVTNANGAWFVHDWSDWNFDSDDVNQRVRRFREERRNVAGNVAGNVASAVTVTPPDTDTDISLRAVALKEINSGVSTRAVRVRETGRFGEFWEIWSVRGTANQEQALRAWLSVVTGENENDAIECARSYVAVFDDPAHGFNPENFLFVQARGNFAARWPSKVRPSHSDRRDEERIEAQLRTREERRNGR